MATPELYLRFHGRVIEHLGIQMYQNPVDAVAELVANAWDADAKEVDITVPGDLTSDTELVVRDNGDGMTLTQCQEYFLEVGRDRRGGKPEQTTSGLSRPVLGRKGIGKFAGFGVAGVMTVFTTSHITGERTVFRLRLKDLLAGGYVSTTGQQVEVLEYHPPDPARREKHGTTVQLTDLSISTISSPGRFAVSMARRFLIPQSQADFTLRVNDRPLPDGLSLGGVQYAFPRDYQPEENPLGLTIDSDEWGNELVNGRIVKWRILFHRNTIDEEELRGVTVFVNNKLAQKPFLFNLTKGLEGQHGTEYVSGQVRADFVDAQQRDLIATERQRINWNHPETKTLLEWGQARLRQLLKIWAERRSQEKLDRLEKKVGTFGERLDRLAPHEAKTVKRALKQLAQISTLSNAQFEQLGEGVLTAWEQGRLKALIDEIASAKEMTQAELLEILLEAKVLTALNTAEAVTTKLLTMRGLKRRIDAGQLENAVRDFIAANPWLISPQWETFQVEKTLGGLVQTAAAKSGLAKAHEGKRVDLMLSSGDQLLILEFMRPGITIDRDHLDRFEAYVDIIRNDVRAQTGGRFRYVSGYIIADNLSKDPATVSKIERLAADNMLALDWRTLLENAVSVWKDILDILAARSPDDVRLRGLLETLDAIEE